MKLASWNVNGLRAVMRKGSLIEFLDRYQPDVLNLQEIKMKPEQVDFEIPGYQLVMNSAERAGYSGTAMVVKNDLIKSVDMATVRRNLPAEIEADFNLAADEFGSPNNEGRVLALDMNDFYLVSVYTPNSKGDLSRLKLRYEMWDPGFLSYMNMLRAYKPVIFSGDLNVAYKEIDLANPKANVGKHGFTDEERRGFHNFLVSGFTDSFRKVKGDLPEQYTWWSPWGHSRERNVGWRIDYFMVDDRLANHIKGAEIFAEQMGSDHCPIGLELDSEAK